MLYQRRRGGYFNASSTSACPDAAEAEALLATAAAFDGDQVSFVQFEGLANVTLGGLGRDAVLSLARAAVAAAEGTETQGATTGGPDPLLLAHAAMQSVLVAAVCIGPCTSRFKYAQPADFTIATSLSIADGASLTVEGNAVATCGGALPPLLSAARALLLHQPFGSLLLRGGGSAVLLGNPIETCGVALSLWGSEAMGALDGASVVAAHEHRRAALASLASVEAALSIVGNSYDGGALRWCAVLPARTVLFDSHACLSSAASVPAAEARLSVLELVGGGGEGAVPHSSASFSMVSLGGMPLLFAGNTFAVGGGASFGGHAARLISLYFVQEASGSGGRAAYSAVPQEALLWQARRGGHSSAVYVGRTDIVGGVPQHGRGSAAPLL